MTDAQLEACFADARADPEFSSYGGIDPKPAYAIAGDERCAVAFNFKAPDLQVIYYFRPGAVKPESKCMGSL
ncbi:MAG: hypothetical protein JWO82_1404 [Akkermansiaceae bacterium]|nr:hypothetical protein [Akkermansiaceae bacterium]